MNRLTNRPAATLMTYDDAYAYLHALPRFSDQGALALQPGLERMAALMDAMGRPHKAYPSVHIAGTNGKGSTASMLAAVATAAGRRTGLHTSPHLVYLGERLRIDGVPAPESWIAGAVGRFRDSFEAVRPSFFEATTALSLLYFAEAQVDLAVVEVGLGGGMDATNIIEPRLAIITSIGLEHTDLLGDTLEAIARAKAGIIKPGVPVLTAVAQPEAREVIEQEAERQRAPFEHVREAVQIHEVQSRLEGLILSVQTPLRRYENLEVGLPGGHQTANALLALRAAERVVETVVRDAAPVYHGLRDVRRLAGLRGRLETVQAAPLVVADVAHNADGLAAALAFVHAQRPEARLFVLLGLMRDKDLDAIARLLADAGASVFPVHLSSPRAVEPEMLAGRLRASGLAVEKGGSVEEGRAWFYRRAASDDVLLITGSHQVVEQIYSREAESREIGRGN